MSSLLILEDDTTLAYGIEIALKSHGFEVTQVASVGAAKKVFQEKDFDLAVLDVMLEDGTGYAFLEYVRQSSNIPVIFLSALKDELNIVTGLNLGADDYMVKPFNIGELVSRIQANLRRIQSKTYHVIQSETISLNKGTMEVTQAGKLVHLSVTEYKLLLYFMENSRLILSKQTLLEAIWDIEGNFVDDNTLAVNVKRLRDKLNSDKESEGYIKTIRGIGYVWDKGCIKC